AGIDAAAFGDTVLVAPGTYTENIDFKGKSILVHGARGAEATVIDGNKVGTVVICRGSGLTEMLLEGFTVTNGDALEGGGLYIQESITHVKNCIFTSNRGVYGGGICNRYSSLLIMRDCVISSNQALFGGGMYYGSFAGSDVTDCTFLDNTASDNASFGLGGG